MTLKKILFTLGFVFFWVATFKTQTDPYPKNYFRSPLDTTLQLAGNFGELRNNHFHAGLDIRTLSQEGLKIYSVADGYVSRIKISPVGYGKALYITHPNGYVSVYAHLQSFNGAVAEYVKKKHYELQSFEIDVFPGKDEVPVKQGDIVAFSGNTGSSQGPHLHFEMRDEKTEKAINPQLFGIAVNDCKKPFIGNITIFPLDVNSYVNGLNKPLTANYLKMGTQPLATVCGNIGLGIETVDSEDNSAHVNGTYSVELHVNNKLIYKHTMEKIGFDESRAINCFTDYAEKRRTGRNIQRSYLVKNNPLKIYSNLVNNGILHIDSDSLYVITYKAFDICGNASERTFLLKGQKIPKEKPKIVSDKHVAVFYAQEPNTFKTNDFFIDMPANILYEDIRLQFSATKSIVPGCFSPLYAIHKDDIPVHSYYTIGIKAPTTLSDSLKQKLYISYSDTKGKISNEGGEFKDGFIVAKTRSFGNFVLKIDTMPPTVTSINVKAGKPFYAKQLLRFKAFDGATGIKDYDGYIDGKWILFEYDQKRNLLFHELDGSIEKGTHNFDLLVKDGRGNVRRYKSKITIGG
ncbi:MAG: M23 family metallopeptidase [Bacteroidetes bacterium]|nr:M23 family metallopeptidase [Bacteroidota bacterium]